MIHTSYKKKAILDYINDLITEYKYTQYDDLTQCDRNDLYILMIEHGGRSDEFCFITQTMYADFILSKIKESIRSPKPIDLSGAFMMGAANYYDDTAEELFNYCMENRDA